MNGKRQGLRFFAPQPRLAEIETEIFEKHRKIGLNTQFLPLTHRNGFPSAFFENFAPGKIVQIEHHRANKSSSAIAALQLNLAGTAFFHIPFDVYLTIDRIHIFEIRADGFGVEKAQLGQFAHRAHHQFLVVFFAGQSAHFAQNNVILGAFVALDGNIVEISDFAFINPYFEINAIAANTRFHRRDTRK